MSEDSDSPPIAGLEEAVEVFLARGGSSEQGMQIVRREVLLMVLALEGTAAKVDPHRRADPFLASTIAEMRSGTASELARRTLGEMLLAAVEAGDGEALRMAAKLSELPMEDTRIAQVYEVVMQLLRESGGHVPSKREVMEYADDYRETWKCLPPRDDKKAWTRIWDDSLLQSILPQATRGQQRER